MRYCPICNGHRAIKHLWYDLKYWWKHKILRQPEPEINVAEVVCSLFPAMIMASMMSEMSKNLQDALEEKQEG